MYPSIEKILNANIKLYEKSNKPKLILLSTGSYSPPHKIHLQNFLLTKEALSNEYDILIGLISPSHDNYIKHKLDDWGIPGNLRIEMLTDIIKEAGQENWIVPDQWEIDQQRFYDFPEVFKLRTKFLTDYVKKQYKGELKIGFVMGSDLAIHTRCINVMTTIGNLICILRPKTNNSYVMYNKNRENLIIIDPNQYKDIAYLESMSSTILRNYYVRGQYDKIKEMSTEKCFQILNEWYTKSHNCIKNTNTNNIN